MPEIKQNFTGGKMNKDVDERLVPKGEYIGAMNIQVSTSEGSDVGTVQNILGNKLVSELSYLNNSGANLNYNDQYGNSLPVVTTTSTCVGAISDEKNDALYWFIAEHSTGYTGEERNSKNFILQHKNGVITPVFVDIVRSEITGGDNMFEEGPGSSTIMYLDPTDPELLDLVIGSLVQDVTIDFNNSGDYTLLEMQASVISVDYTTGEVGLDINFDQLLDEVFNGTINEVSFRAYISRQPVLSFDKNRMIVGINIVDDMLFWTDGYYDSDGKLAGSEPKKINIPRSILGTHGSGIKHTRLINYDQNISNGNNIQVKEEHITVIRKAPLQPPHLEMSTTLRQGIISGSDVMTVNNTAPFLGKVVGNEKVIRFALTSEPFGFEVGDIILLSDDISNLPDDWEIRASIKDVTITTSNFNVLVKIENMRSFVDTTIVTWYGHLEPEPGIFERKLPRFAYRYKYQDGEYSSFSPFTHVAFRPGDFNYQPIKAYNEGMVNSIKSLKIQNFVTTETPLDVVSIDLLYKNETNPTVYLLKTISPNDAILEGEENNYWNTATSLLSSGVSKGSYSVSSENVTLALSSSQSLRTWDNVPKTALAQEVTGNRVVYGNYTQGYDSIQPHIKSWIESRAIDIDGNIGERSVKSLRDYDIGVVWGDKYGRETPVKTSGSLGSINVPKSRSISSNYINVDLKESPDWADYYRVYIKETSNEYYNLAVDRVYDAADGNIWVSFPSVDRNKVDEDTYIILKKGIDSDELVTEEARYKIVAIENEAPEYIKTSFELLVRTNTDASRGAHSCNMWNGDNPCDNTSNPPFPGGGMNAPTVGMKGFSLNAGRWLRDYSTVSPIGMGLTSPKVLLDEVSSNTSGSTTDELYVSFSREITEDGVTTVSPVSAKYHVVNVSDINQNQGNSFFYINLDQGILAEDDWITDHLNDSTSIPGGDNIHVLFWKKTIINKPEFDGRFFVKILGGDSVTKRLTNRIVLDNQLMVSATTSLFKIEDNNFDDFMEGDAFNFHPDADSQGVEIADDSSSPYTKDQWDNKLDFGGSNTIGRWFIDKATFAGQQLGAQNLPSSGKLDYDYVKTKFSDAGLGITNQESCDTTTPLEQTYNASCSGIVYNYTQSYTNTENIGTGYSLASMSMKGVWADGSDQYIDLAYSQLGPTGNTDPQVMHRMLDWRIGDPGNTSSDQEEAIIKQLKTNSRFRLKGSDVVYKIKGVNKFRLFNYQGAMTIVGYGFDHPPPWAANITQSVVQSLACGWFTNDKFGWYSSRMANKTNRRVTYRIKYEVDELFTPSALYSTINAIDEDSPYGDITHNESAQLEFLTDFTTEGSNPISNNPAIFETEPKEEVDIDIYYEASSSLAALPLTNKNKHLFIPIGSTIIPPVNTNFPEGIFVTSWEIIQLGAPEYIIYLSTEIIDDHFDMLELEDICYVEKDNGEIVSFEVIGGVAGSYGTVALIINPKNEVGLNWFNCWSFNNGVESNRIGDTYNKPYVTNGATASSSTEELKEQENRKNGLIYSGIYNSTSGINNLNQFISAEKITKDINPTYGSIQKLHAGWGQGGDLLTLCEDRVLKILANKDALFNADGNSNITSTKNVLGQAIPYSGEYGISKNPESFASEAYRVYFTDKVRGSVMRLSMDGLTPISNHGMKDWFRDKLMLGDKLLLGSYDDRKDEYNITIKGSSFNRTATFKEDVKGWVSFKSFIPEHAISCANEYYTFLDGRIWKHHDKTVNRNTFYNQDLVESKLEAVFNEVPGSVKSFKTINYEGSKAKVTSKDENGNTLLDSEYFNLSDVPGWYASKIMTNLERGGITEFINKEGKWFGYVVGDDININPAGNIAIGSSFDTENFSIQGIGRTASVTNNVVVGCTDSTAFNYDSAATVDDGSCVAVVLGCTESWADNYNALANTNDGSCSLLGCTTGPLAVEGQELLGGSLNFDSNANVDDGSCIPAVFGCTINGNHNYNYLANLGSEILSDGTNCGYPNCMCVPVNPGCTDPTAGNYYSSTDELTAVNYDNGSCEYYGCTDPYSPNYSFSGSNVDSQSNSFDYLNGTAIDDNSCYYGGCTSQSACNFNTLSLTMAMDDDGSCYFCGDNSAVNFDGIIGQPDYSCVAACEYCEEVANVTVSSQATATYNANGNLADGSVTLVWAAPTSAYLFQYVISGNGIPGGNEAPNNLPAVIITPSGNATESYTISGLAAGTYTFYVTAMCGTLQGDNQYAGTMLPGGQQGTGPFGPFVSPTITLAQVNGCTDPLYVEYDPFANVDDGSCAVLVVLGCTNFNSSNYDPLANTDDGTCQYFGCTDALATNFDQYALVDDGSCAYPPVFGCTDPIAENYDPLADTNPDPSVYPNLVCTYILGCMDSGDANYDALATASDGSCTYDVLGCTDNSYLSYDASATFDDGSCNNN